MSTMGARSLTVAFLPESLSRGLPGDQPGVLSIPPTTPGTGEQVELRAVYMQGNNEVGSYSDAKPALIAP